MSEKHRLKMLENTVLRRIFGRKREEVIGEQRELNNEELNDLHSSLKTIVVIKSSRRWAGHVARMEDRRGAYSVETEGKKPTWKTYA